jgi:cell shape-determining protein MreD
MMRKYGYVLVLIAVFAILQPTLLFSFGLTVYMPDIVAVIVAAQAFSRSLKAAAAIAIFAGALVDLVSPALGIFGISSISYLVIAILVNRFVSAPHESALKPITAAAAAPAVAVFIKAVVMLIIFQPVAFGQAVTLFGWQIIAGAVFAVFLVPVIDLLDRPLYRDSLPLRVHR